MFFLWRKNVFFGEKKLFFVEKMFFLVKKKVFFLGFFFRTKETLKAGNYLSVINILMQLRKVCNHPNLFEERPVLSPLVVHPVVIKLPALVFDIRLRDADDAPYVSRSSFFFFSEFWWNYDK